VLQLLEQPPVPGVWGAPPGVSTSMSMDSRSSRTPSDGLSMGTGAKDAGPAVASMISGPDIPPMQPLRVYHPSACRTHGQDHGVRPAVCMCVLVGALGRRTHLLDLGVVAALATPELRLGRGAVGGAGRRREHRRPERPRLLLQHQRARLLLLTWQSK
jgi:hypothetical protein